jgi:hypothetical protein
MCSSKENPVTTGKTLHASVTEARTGKGWAVTVVENGENTTSAVFHDEQLAQEFSDSERQRLGLKQLHARSGSTSYEP